ncbi:peptidase, M61 glycyl aminopeptidase family protein [Leptospira wolbachii serovar Codice str. CDC]|uniref:Peptidase, M61 glycyl aminopeptidase family protein n=1 Tax=Leptospira wolbachii serovar Codice str. CDC TaxID=1218599 RepID=R8ZYQ2_9LEPT|nr:M61 family metallopeptidase [Leptospira wolbachii]EOQ94864.1 peptidase, M61 glycyl aminopeptidase family protein [Leptospira wolbachii serovar Codice str. CDC]
MAKEQEEKTIDRPDQSNSLQLDFEVSLFDLFKHYFQVRLRVKTDQSEMNFCLPSWTPGSYMIRDYGTHLHKFAVKNLNTGEIVPWEMVDLHRWKLKNLPSEFEISYIIYAFEDFTVRTNYLETEFGFINPPALFLYPEGKLEQPSTIQFQVSNHFPYVYSSLTRSEEDNHLFFAENFDELFDSPFHLSKQNSVFFTAGTTKHELLVEGDVNFDFKTKLAQDLKRITETQIDWMMDSPNPYYLFVLNLSLPAYGGLEHRASSINYFNPELIFDEEEYKKLLELLSHEYFHLWNIKRIRPIALGPFDYQKPNLTRELWIAEGFTSFYDAYFLYHSGFLSKEEYLSKLQSDILSLEDNEADFWMSLEESSFTAWTKYYKRNGNSHNITVSYYTKGGVIALCMNLFLLKESKEKKTIRHVFQNLNEVFVKTKNRGFTKQEFFDTVKDVTGVDLKTEFNQYLEYPKPIPVDHYLDIIGIQRIQTDLVGETGFKTKEKNGNLYIQKLLHKSDMDSFDLMLDDEILAINGKRATANALQKLEKNLGPGEKFHLILSRSGKIKESMITASGYYKTRKFVIAEDSSDDRKELRDFFLRNIV